ncbi:MAG: hypothetical protein ABEH43_05750, partial [Flavobacteriales bacterium]
NNFNVEYISISDLQEVADQNLKFRKKELEVCNKIKEKGLEEFEKLYKERMVELAMQDVPVKVKEIRERAMDNVFAEEINEMDDESREVLEKVVKYLEKKYISMPMKMAREIMVNNGR